MQARLESQAHGTEMETLPQRPFREWDKGDHLAFALAGLQNAAGRALRDQLAPGARGWNKAYPGRLADELDFWVEKIRAANINVETPGTAYGVVENGALLVDTVYSTRGQCMVHYLVCFTGNYVFSDFNPTDGGLSADVEFLRHSNARIVPVSVRRAAMELGHEY